MKAIFTLFFFLFFTFSFAQKRISIDSVKFYKNEMVTVCGKVFETKFSDSTNTTFLEVAGFFPNVPLTIVILEKTFSILKKARNHFIGIKRFV